MSRAHLLMAAGVALIVVAIFAGLLLHPSATTNGQRSLAALAKPEPVVGHPAPTFTLTDTQGKRVRLAQYRGRVIVLNFFATWCIPCRHELPMINRLYQANRSRFTVLAIDKQEPASDVRQFASDQHLAFAPVLDPDLTVWQRYRITIQPVSVWIDASGVIRDIHYTMDAGFVNRELHRLGA